MLIPVNKPFVPNQKKLFDKLSKIHNNEWFTNFGPFHEELVNRLEDYLGIRNLLLVSNGTLALQISYRALGIKSKLLTSPFSFIASSSAARWEGLELEYSDIDLNTLNLDISCLEKVDGQIEAIQAVHVFGNPVDTTALNKFASSRNAKTIIDGAHAFGVKKNNRSVLLDVDATTLSFHSTKVFHTVEGGGIVFKNKSDYETAKSLINFGYDEFKNVNRVGINCKLNEYQAAVGLTVLEEIDSIIEKRLELFFRYQKLLNGIIDMPVFDIEADLNGAYMPVIFESEETLLAAVKYLDESGIQTRRYFYPSLNEIPAVAGAGSCPNSESVSRRILCLPLYTQMTNLDLDFVVKKLLEIR